MQTTLLTASGNTACTIIFTQHAQTDWNVQRLNQGHVDTPLNAYGHAASGLLSERLKDTPLTAIYSSDLRRALETAAPVALAHGLEIHKEPRLREKRSSTKAPNDADYPLLEWHTDTETDDDLQLRMVEVMNEIASAHPGGTVLVVSHGAASRQFFRWLSEQQNDPESHAYKEHQAAVNTLRCGNGSWSILSINDIEHLRTIQQDNEPNAG